MSEPAPLLVTISGIRGVVGQSITPEVVRRFAAAFGSLLPEGARVVLARDTRPSGAAFAEVVAAALRDTGCEVLDLGLCSTPGAKLMVLELGAEGGIVITASHNPAPWNGLKLVRSDGIFLNAEQGGRVEEGFQGAAFLRRAGGHIHQVDSGEVRHHHLSRLLANVDAPAIRRARLSAVVDPCNGTGGLLLPELLESLGVEAHFINAAPDGRFAHDPEPIPENLVQLGEAVRRRGSCLGFAVDPDADRVTLVDDSGRPVGEDYTLALAVRTVTALQPGTVVTTLSTSQVVTDVAHAHGCPVVLTPVGEVHVIEKMLEEQAVIGGEGNGGVILPEVNPGRDAAVGLSLVLQALAHSGQTLQQLLAALPRYFIEKRKVECTPAQVEQAIALLRQRYPRAFVHPVEDGVKLYLSGELECPWIHLRPSNTEPIVRIIAESQTQAEADGLCDETGELLRTR
jgi:phosphomannomutase